MTKQKHFYLIRGLVRESRHWGPIVQDLKVTFPDARVSLIEIPGAGDYHQLSSPLSIRGMVEQMRRDYLRHKTTSEHSHVVAISLGGMIACEWMNLYPNDYQSGTLINTSFGKFSPLIQRLKPEALTYLGRIAIAQGRRKEELILELVSNDPEIRQKTVEEWTQIHKERPVSFANAMRQLIAAARFRSLERPNIPLQLLASTNDRMVNVECSRAIAREWKCPITEHPEGGHDLSTDDPIWVSQKMRMFISEL